MFVGDVSDSPVVTLSYPPHTMPGDQEDLSIWLMILSLKATLKSLAVSVSWFLEWVLAGVLSVLVETQVGLSLSILHPGLAKRAILSWSEVSEFTFYVNGVQKSILGVWLSRGDVGKLYVLLS